MKVIGEMCTRIVKMVDRDGASYLNVGVDISGEGQEATGGRGLENLHDKK
jgi:hypothetical protein